MLKLQNFQRSDTIIEVMVALSVLGLAFGISYATANHALQVSQNAQEHSQALQLLDSQVDQSRAISSSPDLYNTDGSWFCVWLENLPPPKQSQSEIAIERYTNNGIQNAATEAPHCQVALNGQTSYTVYDSYDSASDANGVDQDIFTFTIIWPGLGNLGQQQEQISYKLHGDSP